MEESINVLGGKLEPCSTDPMTGWFRDGCCNTDENDHGLHTVCVKVNSEFLEWCKGAGNDSDMAPQVVLESTRESALEMVELETLKKYAYKSD